MNLALNFNELDALSSQELQDVQGGGFILTAIIVTLVIAKKVAPVVVPVAKAVAYGAAGGAFYWGVHRVNDWWESR